MKRLWFIFLPWFVLVAGGSFAWAQITPEGLDKAKRATALVEIRSARGVGSAFCIDADGFFLTHSNVVTLLGENDVSLILRPGEKDQRKLKAKVVRTDPALGLSLLRVEKPGTLTALSFGDASSLLETASVTAFGYPIGKVIDKNDYPSIIASTGRVTSLRKVQGELKELQLEASVNSGGSGGPVLNSKGLVIGVMVSGFPNTGVNFAIPINSVNRFLDEVSVDLSPLGIAAAQAQKTQEFEIRVAAFRRSTANLTVELMLSMGLDDHRVFPARQVDAHTFTVKAAPLPPSASKLVMRLTVKDAQTELVCQVPDQQILVGGKPTMLSTLHQLERREKTVVTFADKEVRETSVSGLEAIETRMFGVVALQNFSRAESIAIAPMESALASISYRIRVRQAGKMVSEMTGELPILGATAALSKRDDIELLLCNFDADEIKRFNGRTGKWIDDFASGSGLSRPACFVFGPDGHLYVSGSNSQTIHRYNGRTGQFIDVFVGGERNGG